MAKKEDRKKQKKRRKEKAKAQKSTLRSRYPRIVVHRDGEDEEFMNEVERLANEFDFDNDECCDSQDRHMFRVLRQVGLSGIYDYLSSPEAEADMRQRGLSGLDYTVAILHPIMFRLGNWLFEHLPAKYRDHPLPFFYFHTGPVENGLEVSFEFLPRNPSEFGTIYSSPLMPTVELGGGQFRVGFFRHAIEQACMRMAAHMPIQYDDFQHCYRFFRHCVYFQPVQLLDGQEALRLYAPCEGQRLSSLYLQDIAGLDPSMANDGKHHYVLGYCPIAIVRRYAVAKTFLLPGYAGTPELALLDGVSLSGLERKRLRQMTDGLTCERLLNNEATELMRFFHTRGVPQVVELQQPVLDFSR